MRIPKTMIALAAIALAFPAIRAAAHDASGEARATVHEAAGAAAVTLSGTVNEVVVDDTTRGTSRRYVELQLADGTLVPLEGAPAESLAQGTRVEVSGRHRGKPLEVATARTLERARPSQTKVATEVDGTLAIVHVDYFAEDRSTFLYEVHERAGNVHRLRMGSTPASLEPGMKVRVRGRAEADGESLTPERITILARPALTGETEGPVTKAAVANSVLVIMANFTNTATPSMTTAQAQQVMMSNTDSVANFFRETSYGQQIMNVTVTGWLKMSISQPATCGSADWRGIGTSADAAAKALGAGYDPANYNFVVYVFPAVPSCGWVGLAYIGYPRKAWINGASAFRTSAIAHEMGHNFGLLHAASLRCSGTPIGGSCSSSEYGDPFDAMGNQRAMHFNAMQKSKLAWIPSTSVTTHAGGLATYTLSPLEVAGGATYAVKIPTGSANRTYWLEFRQPIGFDSPLASFPNNGAQVRVASPFETQCGGCDAYSDDTQLLDMTPATSTFNDATLPAGQSFSDPTYGINVTVLSASASALTVQVGTGGSAPPPAPTTTSTSLTSTANPSVTGATVTFTATVSGSAPTGSLRFTDNGATLGGCGGVVLSGSGDARSASCATNALTTGTHAIAATYSGDAANSASTSGSLMQVVNAPAQGTNVALAANGGVASSSSTYSAGFSAGVNDGSRSGAPWGSYAGWNDATYASFPDWLQVQFAGTRTIDHVVVYSVQDNYQNPAEPTESMTFTKYGLTSFQVQAWNGATWVTLASVAGNNLVKRTVAFAPFATDRIRIYITGSADGLWSRVTEIEAWSPSATAPQTNVALASNGGSALASSTYSAGFSAIGINDNRRSGATWGVYAGWNDATPASFPDWAEVRFSGRKTIDHVVVYSVQDNYQSPIEPADSTICTLYALRAFQVQGFDGFNWITLASVTGNNLAKRAVWFAPYSTDRIRINVTATQDGLWSRITEFEAWGN